MSFFIVLFLFICIILTPCRFFPSTHPSSVVQTSTSRQDNKFIWLFLQSPHLSLDISSSLQKLSHVQELCSSSTRGLCTQKCTGNMQTCGHVADICRQQVCKIYTSQHSRGKNRQVASRPFRLKSQGKYTTFGGRGQWPGCKINLEQQQKTKQCLKLSNTFSIVDSIDGCCRRHYQQYRQIDTVNRSMCRILLFFFRY